MASELRLVLKVQKGFAFVLGQIFAVLYAEGGAYYVAAHVAGQGRPDAKQSEA